MLFFKLSFNDRKTPPIKLMGDRILLMINDEYELIFLFLISLYSEER